MTYLPLVVACMTYKTSEPKVIAHDDKMNVELDEFPKLNAYGHPIKLSVGDRVRINDGSIFTIVPNGYHAQKYTDKTISRDEKSPSSPKNHFTAFGRSKVNIYG